VTPVPTRVRKLTLKEKSELAGLPDKIETAERERAELFRSLADPVFLRNGAAVGAAKAKVEALGVEIAALTARWEELEAMVG
jgi:hypothetical protein